MLSYQKLTKKQKTKKMNENQVFAILKLLGSFRYNNVKF